MVAGVEFHDAARTAGEHALAVGRGAPVVGADEVSEDLAELEHDVATV